MRKLGFTLAEVLITLVIIGVIAAMTVPTLMQNTNAEEFRTGLKKAISATNQALTLNYALEGMTAQDFADATTLVNEVFKPRMSIVEAPTFEDYTLGGESLTGNEGGVWVTNDGMIYYVTNFSSEMSDSDSSLCNAYQTVPCGSEGPQLWIDVNGVKKPNMATTSSKRPRDQYQALIYSQKIVPYDDPTQEVMYGANTALKNKYTASAS